MKKGQKNKVYRWMDDQILAHRLINTPLYSKDPFYVCNCSWGGKEIHLYKIDNLCKELKISYKIKDFDSETVEHFFIYKGYKFYGLYKKGVNHEG